MSMRNKSRISRRAFLGAAAGGVFMAPRHRGAVRRGRAGKRPNVVYLFSDEHRWQSMSFTELPQIQTPHMATLASQGAEFTQCISNYPVCSPHRAMLLTGRWPYQTGVIDNGLPLAQSEMTIGKAFAAEGYRTGYIGKWHLVGKRAEPFGFEHSLIWDNTDVHWDQSIYHPAVGGPVQPRGYNATLMTDQALEFMEQHRKDPFFLMVSWNPPHASFVDAPETKKALYPQGSLPRRPNWRSAQAGATEGRPFGPRNDWPEYEGYHAHISAIDDELGRVMARLDELELTDNTILIYSSDHGSMFGSHGVGGKRQPYEESIRVPFLVRWPDRVEAGRKSPALFGTIDIVPTVCALAGVRKPKACAGNDLSPHLLGKRGPNPESQFIMHISKDKATGGQNHPAPLFRGVRTQRYTYASLDGGNGLLFDNHADPYQVNNLHDEPAYRSVREEHEAMTREWLRKSGDGYRIGA